jgi:hypothetical protein
MGHWSWKLSIGNREFQSICFLLLINFGTTSSEVIRETTFLSTFIDCCTIPSPDERQLSCGNSPFGCNDDTNALPPELCSPTRPTFHLHWLLSLWCVGFRRRPNNRIETIVKPSTRKKTLIVFVPKICPIYKLFERPPADWDGTVWMWILRVF